MTDLLPLVIVRLASVVAGLVFVGYAVRGYQRHHNRGLLMLAIAISLMVLGVVLEGIAFLVFGASLGTAETIEASVMLVAFLLLIWSVHYRRSAPPE